MRSLGEMVECENGEGEGEGEGETTTTGLVCLAAQMAFEVHTHTVHIVVCLFVCYIFVCYLLCRGVIECWPQQLWRR